MFRFEGEGFRGKIWITFVMNMLLRWKNLEENIFLPFLSKQIRYTPSLVFTSPLLPFFSILILLFKHSVKESGGSITKNKNDAK